MGKMIQMRKKFMTRQMSFDQLMSHSTDFFAFADKIVSGKPVDEGEFESFLRLCLDMYAYDPNGRVLIPDMLYDRCMNVWKENNHEVIVYPDDVLEGTKWSFRRHEIPGLVGTLGKIYDYKELKTYIEMMRDTYDINIFTLAPKYDGISVAVRVEDGTIVSALTRYNGEVGQDITAVIKLASNANSFFKPLEQNASELNSYDGWYKCEVLVSTPHFEELIKEKKYSNRRSATSGIINTPSNIDFGRFLTLIPLLYYNPEAKTPWVYLAPYKENYMVNHPRDLMDHIEDRLKKLRSSDFPYRVDGIVMVPCSNKFSRDEGDLMTGSLAFKVNTAEATTTIEEIYMSVGRLGNATPMARVKPVEVNETIVTDVSLGSYERFMRLNLYEGEEIVVFSAGDVIPQMRVTDHANNIWDKPLLKMKKVCPYCGEKLTRVSTEYRCENPKCVRVNSGRIVNFADKIGIMGFSDKAFEDFYRAGIITSIADIFKVTREDICKVDGYEVTSADNFIDEVTRISNTPIPISNLFGALGIPNIYVKKCKRIFELISLKQLLKAKYPRDIIQVIIGASGIGYSTAETFATFVLQNRDLIKFLINELKIVEDVRVKGSLVFTGFRSADWTDKFAELGYEVNTSVTNGTVAVISASSDFSTGNCKAAIKKGIPIYTYSDIELLYDKLKRKEYDPDILL